VEQQELRMKVFAAVLNDAQERGIATHTWSKITNETMRTAIATIILDRCKSSKGSQVQTVFRKTKEVCGPSLPCVDWCVVTPEREQIFTGPPTAMRSLIPYVGFKNRHFTICKASSISQHECKWNKSEQKWFRSCKLLYVIVCH
jgi:hypothetical protein